MSDTLSPSRLLLLLQHAADIHQSLSDLATQFAAGGADAQAALRMLRNQSHQVRDLLQSLAHYAASERGLCEVGAKLCCTAVRISEVIFSRDERVSWMAAFRDGTAPFVETGLKGKLLGNLGNALADSGRLSEAEAVLKQRFECAVSDTDPAAVGVAKENLGKLLLRRGRFREADPLLAEAFEVARSLSDEAAVTRLLKDVADAAFRRNEADLGVKYLEERLSRCEAVSDPLMTLSTCQILAERLIVIGRLDEAQFNADKAAAIAKPLRLPLRRAAIHGTLGNIAYEQKDYEAARIQFTSARRTFRKLCRVVEQAMTATSLGLTAWKQGRLAQAARWFREALEIDRATGRKNDEAIDLVNLAGVLADQGDDAGAVRHYSERIEILRTLDEQSRAAETLWTLANLHASAGRFDLAVAAGDDALVYFAQHEPSRAETIRSQLQQWTEKIGCR